MAMGLWKVVADVAKLTDGECVFIGGVAVYVYTQRSGTSMIPEATHDVDASITIAASGTLRDHQLLTQNKRLKKAQITVGGIEVDIYVEHQNNLRFDYAELAMYAENVSIGRAVDIQLASLPHLLFLKLDALRSRGASEHGAKDRRDVAKLLVILGNRADPTDLNLVIGNAAKSDLAAVLQVIKSTAFMEITSRNAQAAAKLRGKAQHFVDLVKNGAL
jgi:predicted nucleotidyltransferase